MFSNRKVVVACYFVLKQDRNTVEASRWPQVSLAAVTNTVNFPDPRGDNYIAMATSLYGQFGGYSRTAEQFSLDLKGFVPSVSLSLSAVLNATWKQHLTGN